MGHWGTLPIVLSAWWFWSVISIHLISSIWCMNKLQQKSTKAYLLHLSPVVFLALAWQPYATSTPSEDNRVSGGMVHLFFLSGPPYSTEPKPPQPNKPMGLSCFLAEQTARKILKISQQHGCPEVDPVIYWQLRDIAGYGHLFATNGN